MGEWWNPFDDNEGVNTKTPAPTASSYQIGAEGYVPRINNEAEMNAAAAAARAPVQADYGAATGALMQGGRQMQYSDIAGAGQMALAGQLQDVAAGRGGPSVAELSMGRAADTAARQNLAMSAGGSAPGNTASRIAAINANATAQGGLVRDLGVQRAGEIATARGQIGDVLGQARGQSQSGAGAYNAMAGTAAGMAGNNANLQLQSQAQNDATQMGWTGFGYGVVKDQADKNAQMDTNKGNWAVGQAGNQVNAQANEQKMFGGVAQMAGSGAAMLSDAREKTNIVPAAEDPELRKWSSEISGSDKVASRNAGDVLGAALGGFGAHMTGTESAAPGITAARLRRQDEADAAARMARAEETAQSAFARPTVYPTVRQPGAAFGSMSDIRAKQRIEPASDIETARAAERTRQIDSLTALRRASGAPISRAELELMQEPSVEDTFRQLGSYGYEYKDPEKIGAAPGRHYGPMAQELERTPAGASVITKAGGGMKGIDTGRLALLNASETANQRRELDAIKADLGVGDELRASRLAREEARGHDVGARGDSLAAEIYGAQVAYPDAFAERTPVMPTDLVHNAKDDTFRTPEEQLAYIRSLSPAPRVRYAAPGTPSPTDLMYDARSDEFRTPDEQLRATRRMGYRVDGPDAVIPPPSNAIARYGY